jgi:hypothetical protein
MEECMGNMEQSMKSISTMQEEMREQMTELYNMVANIEKTRQETGENSPRKNQDIEGENSYNGERPLLFKQRHVKFDFLLFNGDEDPTTWACRAEQFFRFQGTT